MKSTTIKLVCASALIAGASMTSLVHAQVVEISKITYVDANGQLVNDMPALVTERSVMIVADANLQLTNIIIGKLRASKVDWKGRLLFVLSGTSVDLKAVAAASSLTGVRWYATPPSKAPAAFGLGGTPFVVGLNAGGSSAWKVLGEPQITDRNFSKLRGWIESAPSPVLTK